MRYGGSYKGVQRFICGVCGGSCIAAKARRVYRHRDEDGAQLAALINAQLPARYSEEMRKEIRQVIAVDILKKKLKRRDLTRAKVGEYARRFFRDESNRFRFVSLEQNIGGGLRLEDALAG